MKIMSNDEMTPDVSRGDHPGNDKKEKTIPPTEPERKVTQKDSDKDSDTLREPRHVSQEEMQKYLPDPDPDDPVSP